MSDRQSPDILIRGAAFRGVAPADMQTASPERRKTPRRKSFLHQEAVSVQAQGTESRPIMVKVKDVSEFGLGVESATPLQRGCIVLITGTISKGISHKKLARAPAKITHCEQSNPGCYVIGLEFTPEGDQAPNAQSLPDSTPDYYDILQLSPKADPDTIHRVYRLLAQRYHPDNRETGDQDLFKQVLDAYRVLSDPQKRAAYDAAFMSTRQLRWKIFDQANATQGREGEKRKRAGILSVL